MGQALNYHPHIHCIISGGGLTKDLKLRKSGNGGFLPVKALGRKFRGKFMACLQEMFASQKLLFPQTCNHLRNSYTWAGFRDSLYNKEWCPYIKETFNGFGNAMEYLGRYTHRIAVTDSRIQSVSESQVSFSAKDYKSGEAVTITLDNEEFTRRLMMHVLPQGFQKIRYYGFLNNRSKKKNLKIIFRIQGHQQFSSLLTGKSMADILKLVWGYDLRICPSCGCCSMRHAGRTFALIH